jgi:hypothetical protein
VLAPELCDPVPVFDGVLPDAAPPGDPPGAPLVCSVMV